MKRLKSLEMIFLGCASEGIIAKILLESIELKFLKIEFSCVIHGCFERFVGYQSLSKLRTIEINGARFINHEDVINIIDLKLLESLSLKYCTMEN